MEATTNSATEQHTKLQLETEAETQAAAPATTATATATRATIIDIPASCHISTSSCSSSSSYDTDCSTASSTCCTRQGEQIYMQRDTLHKSTAAAAAVAQSVTVSAPAAATATATTASSSCSSATAMVCNMQQLAADADEVAMLKFEHRKHWPWFILLISVIEVSSQIHCVSIPHVPCSNFMRSPLFNGLNNCFLLFQCHFQLCFTSLSLLVPIPCIPCSNSTRSKLPSFFSSTFPTVPQPFLAALALLLLIPLPLVPLSRYFRDPRCFLLFLFLLLL